MGWLDNYRQASFRNIEFFVPSAENSGGRRGAIHEFPKKDIPFVEDMGRRARQFNIEAYVLGEDYMSKRNDLLEALEKEGSGNLIHPYLGALSVLCTGYSQREINSETRIARFTITFVEAGIKKFPAIILDTASNVITKKASAISKARSAFEKIYSIAMVPYSVSQNVISTIDKGLTVISNAKKIVSAVSSFARDIDNIKGKISQLAYDVVDLAQEFSDLITFGTNIDDEFAATIENAKQQLDEMRDLFDFVPDKVISSVDPSDEFSTFVQTNAVINAMGLLSVIEFKSVDESQELRDLIFEKSEELILQVTDDELYIALYDLQTAVSNDLDIRSLELPRLATYIPNISLPAIVLSYDFYGTIDEETDIIDRNKISNPNFVPGGVELEVRINV